MIIYKATLRDWIVAGVCTRLQETHLAGMDFHDIWYLHYERAYFELYFLIRM